MANTITDLDLILHAAHAAVDAKRKKGLIYVLDPFGDSHELSYYDAQIEIEKLMTILHGRTLDELMDMCEKYEAKA